MNKEKTYCPNYTVTINGDYISVETILRLKDANGIWRDCLIKRHQRVENEEYEPIAEREMTIQVLRDAYIHLILYVVPEIGLLRDMHGEDLDPISEIQIDEKERLMQLMEYKG